MSSTFASLHQELTEWLILVQGIFFSRLCSQRGSPGYSVGLSQNYYLKYTEYQIVLNRLFSFIMFIQVVHANRRYDTVDLKTLCYFYSSGSTHFCLKSCSQFPKSSTFLEWETSREVS